MPDHDQDTQQQRTATEEAAALAQLIGMTEEARGTAPNGYEWIIRPPHEPIPAGSAYLSQHTWNAWPAIAAQRGDGRPGFAMEIDGYSGVELVDPWTGRTMYVFNAYNCPAHAVRDPANLAASRECDACRSRPIYDTYRTVLDTAQAVGFLGGPEE